MSSPRPARARRVRLHAPFRRSRLHAADPHRRLRLRALLSGRRSRRGQSVVEFALILPVFVFLLLMAIDFGRLFFSYVQVTNAAREGAAYAAAAPTDSVGIEARALQ